MTFSPERDLVKYPRFVAQFADGSSDVFAVPQATLDQGSAAGIVRIVAGEWQRDGHLKPGKIVSIWWPREFTQN